VILTSLCSEASQEESLIEYGDEMPKFDEEPSLGSLIVESRVESDSCVQIDDIQYICNICGKIMNPTYNGCNCDTDNEDSNIASGSARCELDMMGEPVDENNSNYDLMSVLLNVCKTTCEVDSV
jgi:hypothetical protein